MRKYARHDLFSTVHKGLRHALFQTASRVARTDFDDPRERAAATQEVTSCLALLREHAEHEDRFIFPALLRADRELFASLEVDHTRLEQAAIDVESLLPRLAAADDRAAFGAELQRRCHALVAEHLQHMAREEREVNAALWASYDDDELRAIHGQIIAAVPPEQRQTWQTLLFAAISAPERRALEAAMASHR